MKLLFDNSDQHVSGDGAPDLRLHCVLAVADETLDAQTLLDPLEEEFDLPAALVKRGNCQRRQGRIVGQEYQRFAGLRVFEADAPQLLGIVLRDVEPFSVMRWSQMTPVFRSVGIEYTLRASMPRLARVTKKAPA